MKRTTQSPLVNMHTRTGPSEGFSLTCLWHQEYSLIRIALAPVHRQARAYLFSKSHNLTFTVPRKYLASCLPMARVLIQGYGWVGGTHCCRLSSDMLFAVYAGYELSQHHWVGRFKMSEASCRFRVGLMHHSSKRVCSMC